MKTLGELLDGYARCVTYDSVEALNRESVPFGYEFGQLGPGRFEARYRQATVGRLHISNPSYSVGTLVRGAPPPGICILSLVPDAPSSVFIDGPVGMSCSVSFSGVERVLASPAPHQLVNLVVEESLLEAAVQARWGLPARQLLRGATIDVSGPEARSRIVATLIEAIELSAAVDPTAPAAPLATRALEERVLDTFLGGVRPEVADPRVPGRRLLARRGGRLIRERLETDDSLADVASMLGTTLRTLELSFRETYGTTPRTFRHVLRLNAARADLARCAQGTRVSDVAIRWGLVHLGRFSQDYRRLFGEPPSATLRRPGTAAGRRAA